MTVDKQQSTWYAFGIVVDDSFIFLALYTCTPWEYFKSHIINENVSIGMDSMLEKIYLSNSLSGKYTLMSYILVHRCTIELDIEWAIQRNRETEWHRERKLRRDVRKKEACVTDRHHTKCWSMMEIYSCIQTSTLFSK